jgi:hypothetical protein
VPGGGGIPRAFRPARGAPMGAFAGGWRCGACPPECSAGRVGGVDGRRAGPGRILSKYFFSFIGCLFGHQPQVCTLTKDRIPPRVAESAIYLDYEIGFMDGIGCID